MAGWSLSLGKIFGVGLRLHSFFVFLLTAAMLWSYSLNRPLSRGVALWGLVLLAVAVREIARALVAAWFGLEVKNILLLPTGGIFTYASAQSNTKAAQRGIQRTLALTGPVANLLFGLVVAGLILTVAPEVHLFSMRWVTPEHLLRTLVWINFLLAAINLLPAWPLDGARRVRGEVQKSKHAVEAVDPVPAMGLEVNRIPSRKARASAFRMFTGVGPAIAIGLLVLGMVSVNWWLIVAGMAVLFGAQVERQGLAVKAGAESVPVRDVMLTDYTFLSASATLEDAVRRARHTLQDVFPVVRGGNVVGAVARQTVLDALATTGDGYVQGVMSRTFHAASPDEPLLNALERVTGESGASSQLIPVVLGDRVVGIVTPHHLGRAVGFLARKAHSAKPSATRS
jgi:CBS domain-containing protein/Zn-dependent protease